jgi:Dna[CI] antecedent, DciA
VIIDDPYLATALSAYKKRGGRRVPEPQRMGSIITQLIARRGYAQQKTTADFSKAWEAAVTKVGAEGKTRAGRISRGILEIFVVNSAVMQMLTFHKKALAAEMKAAPGGQSIKDVRFKVGPIE